MSNILSFSGHINTIKSIWTKDKVLKLACKSGQSYDYQNLYQNLDENNLVYLVHNSLVTVGVSTTTFMGTNDIVIAFSGEIINYQDFNDLFKKRNHTFESDTDYEFLIYLYTILLKVSEDHTIPDEFKYDLESKNISSEEHGCLKLIESIANNNKTLLEAFEHILNIIQGDFAFILYDTKLKKYLIVRKGYGITPLYYGITQSGECIIASNKRCLNDDCIIIKTFPDNCVLYSSISYDICNNIKSILRLGWLRDNNSISEIKYSDEVFKKLVFNQFTTLEKFIMTSIKNNKLPFGLLFDGSFESQIMLKIMNKCMKKEPKWGSYPHIFSIHLEEYIKNVNENVLIDPNVTHYNFKYSLKDVMNVVPDIIYIMETSDVDIILRAIPLYFLLTKINKGIHLKHLYSPLGLDEFRYFVDRTTLTNKFQKYSEKYGALGYKLPSYLGITLNMSYIAAGLIWQLYNLEKEYWNNFGVMREMAKQYGITDEICLENEKNYLKNMLEKESEVIGITDQEFETGLMIYQDDPPQSKLDYYIRKIYKNHF